MSGRRARDAVACGVAEARWMLGLPRLRNGEIVRGGDARVWRRHLQSEMRRARASSERAGLRCGARCNGTVDLRLRSGARPALATYLPNSTHPLRRTAV